jgi:outer membrane protein assembly factor BamD (BamD/ComL family)
MRHLAIAFVFTLLAGNFQVAAQEKSSEGPSSEKAQKTYKEAQQYLHDRRPELALDAFRKADKQDGGHCVACQHHKLKYGVQLEDWKTAETAAEEMISEAEGQKQAALAHYQLGVVLFDEGQAKNKQEIFGRISIKASPDLSRDYSECKPSRTLSPLTPTECCKMSTSAMQPLKASSRN